MAGVKTWSIITVLNSNIYGFFTDLTNHALLPQWKCRIYHNQVLVFGGVFSILIVWFQIIKNRSLNWRFARRWIFFFGFLALKIFIFFFFTMVFITNFRIFKFKFNFFHILISLAQEIFKANRRLGLLSTFFWSNFSEFSIF